MYKQVDTPQEAKLVNGSIIHPAATLEDEYGGRFHFAIDDHCYVLYGEHHHEENESEVGCSPVTHIFGEAFEVLKKLPSPV